MRLTRRHLLRCAPVALASCAIPAALANNRARQVSFKRWQADSDMVFDYNMVDYDGKPHRLGFRLPVRVVDESRRLVSVFTNEGLADYVEAALHNYAARIFPDMDVDIRRQPTRLEFVVRGSSQMEVNRVSAILRDEYERAEREFLAQNYLVAEGRNVFIDYTRIVGYYAPILRPAAHAVASAAGGGGAMGRLALALALIQTIPYDQLDSRDVESGFDFVTPPTLFDTNKGDCDSKAVALAAMLRTMLEPARQILVLLPQHAILGIDMPAKGGNRTLTHGGRQYLLMEPAGPAPFLPGELFPTSAAELKAGRIERVVSL